MSMSKVMPSKIMPSKVMPSKLMSEVGYQDTSFGAQSHTQDNGPGSAHPSQGAADSRQSPLAELVSSHLRSRGLRQIDFCRQVGFDQGLLSKILSSVANTLNVETAIKLAEGMNLPAGVIFEAIGKRDVHEMLIRIYGRGHG